MPKNKTKTRSYSYDPSAKIGYDVIRNFPAVEDVGTAIQSHNLDVASKIDSEMSKRRRDYYSQNAKEIEWENKKKSDKKSLINKLLQYPMPTAFGTMNQLGALEENVGIAYNHIKNRDVPDMPEDYGLGDFLSDQWHAYFGEMNHLQAEDARGYQVRMKNDQRLIKAYNDSLDKLDEIDSIDYRLSELAGIDRNGLSNKQLQTMNQEIDSLRSRREQLRREYESLAPERTQLEQTVRQSELGRAVDDIFAGNEYFGKGGLTGIFGKTTAAHDEMNDARRYLYDINTSRADRKRTRQKLQWALNEFDELNKGWNAIIKENEDAAKEYKDKISSWYKGREEKAGTDFFDADTYLFKMPGIMGGSNSSYMKQLPAMAAGLVGGIAASVASAGVAVPALLAGLGTSFTLNRAAGISENNAEVAISAIEKIKDKTGLTDDEIKGILSGKFTDQKRLRQIAENIQNSENLFRTDMAATTWDAAINSALQTVPIGKLSGLTKMLRGTRAFRKAITTPAMKKILRSKLGKDMLSDFTAGYGAGETVNPIVGAALGIGNATVGRLSKEAAKRFGNFVVKTADSTKAGALLKKLAKSLDMTSEAALRINPFEIEAKRQLLNGTSSKYIKGIGGRMIKSAISEGIEEGKQYLNAEAFKNDTMDSKIMSTLDVALTDAVNGLKSGSYILGIPLDGIGVVDLKDRQLLAEIKGGMLGGWGHTTMVNVLQSTVPYIREKRANEIALQSFYADKVESFAKYNQYSNWVKRGLFNPGYNDVLSSIGRLREINENYKNSNPDGEYGVDPSLIDEAEQNYKRVISIAQNPLTRKQAESAGITIRSIKNPSSWKSNKDYHNFVALKAMLLDKKDEIRKNLSESSKNVTDVEKEVARRLDHLTNQEGLEELLGQLQKSEEEEFEERLSGHDGSGLITEQDLKSDEQRRSERINKTAETINRESDYDINATKNIAFLAALLKYREELETGLELQKNNPNAKVRRGLSEQLKELDKKIEKHIKEAESFIHSLGFEVGDNLMLYKNNKQSIATLEDVESHLAYNLEEHEMLRDAYEEYLKWQDQMDTANKTYDELIGRLQRVDENGNARELSQEDLMWNPYKDMNHVAFTKGSAKNIIKSIKEMEDDDDDFESAIEQVYKGELQAKHLQDENGWDNGAEIRPVNVRPVYDTNGEQVVVQFDENGYINRRLAENEYVDDFGRVWEYIQDGRKDPFAEAQKPRKTLSEIRSEDRLAFRLAWNKIQGSVLPMTPEAYQEQILKAKEDAERARLASDIKVPQKNVFYLPPRLTIKQRVEKEITPQEAVLNMLDEKYELDKELVLKDPNGYHTTSQDYFITVNGTVTRMSRVHSVKPESYIHKDQKSEVANILSKLKSATSAEELERIIDKEIDSSSKEDSKVYMLYIKENQAKFFLNPTAENAKEFSTTLEHLAQSLIGRITSPSIRMGNVADELNRIMYGVKEWYSRTSTDAGIRQLFDSKNESEGKTYSQLFGNNFEAFKKLILQMRKQYEYYTKTLGWELRALPYTWRANFKGTGWVAGETDMIGVDKDGGIHVIDFKTSYHSFETEYVPNIDLTTKYNSLLSELRKEDFNNEKPGKKAREVLRKIKQDEKVEKISIVWNEDIGSAVIVDKTRSFLELPNMSYGQVISAFDDYSNQQTAYALMIEEETQGGVLSIEVLPYLCKYDRDFRIIYSVTQQSRIPLIPKRSMFDILNKESEKDANVSRLKNEVDILYNELKAKIKELQDHVASIFDDLSHDGKFIFADYSAKFDNILIPENDDIDAISAVFTTLSDLFHEYESVLADIDADYARQKAIEVERKKTENGQKEIELENATNKKRSYGNTSRTNLNYKQVGADRDLELATSSAGFITDADFELYIDGDKVLCNISYNGKTWNGIEIDTKYNNSWFPKGKSLFDEVKRLSDIKKPNQRIVPVRSTMDRTPGRIKLAVKDGHLVYLPISSTDLFSGEDILDVELSTTYKKVGFVDYNGNVMAFDGSESARKPIMRPYDIKEAPAAGTLIYKKSVPKNEKSTDDYVPVALDRVKMTTEGESSDTDFIINLLLNPDQLDKPYFLNINGEYLNVNATGRQLANLMITVVDNPNRVGNAVCILRNPADPDNVMLVKREDIASNSTGRGVFNISTQKGIDDLKKELSTMSISERHDVLLSRLGTDNSQDLPFAGIRKFFKEQNQGLTSIKITDSISFDIDDFKTAKSKLGIVRNGISGFGYYLKHNLLITQYGGMGSCNVTIGDVILEDSSDSIGLSNNGVIDIPTNPIGSLEDNTIDSVDIDESDDIDSYLLKTESTTRSAKQKPLSKEKAEKHLREILGDNVPIEFTDGFLKLASGPAHILGNCKTDCITLSTYAFAGVEYHEAFHRIFELLVDEHKRDVIYDKIAKRIGVSLYNEDGSENVEAFREVAEYLADTYMDYMQNRWNDVKIPILTKIYNTIYHWVQMLFHFGNRDLYRTFAEVNKGVYRNAMPSAKSVERFNRLYKNLHYKTHGVDFVHIMNEEMYDKIKETAMFCIIHGQNLDKSGKNISTLGQNINKNTFKAGVEKWNKKGYDLFGESTSVPPTVGQLALREFYEKFDTETLRDDMAATLSIISTDYIKIREEESNIAANGDTNSVVGSSIGEHTRSSYEFSRFDKSSSRVRFLFATIPDMQYVPKTVVDENGRSKTVYTPQLNLNEFGLPTFVPVNAVFNEFLNMFHDVDTIGELKYRLQLLGKEYPMYKTLSAIFNKMYKRAYNIENGIVVRDSDAEALLSQFMNIIRSNKHNFDILTSSSKHESICGKYTLTIQPTDSAYNANFYPRQWNQMLVGGGTSIIKISEDGSIIFNPENPNYSQIFARIKRMFTHAPEIKIAPNNAKYTDVGIKEWINNAIVGGNPMYLKLIVNGKPSYYDDPKNTDQIYTVKTKIVEALNMIGINMNIQEFDYMLRHKYGTSDFTALGKMFNSTDKSDSMTSFFYLLENISNNGRIRETFYVSGKKVSVERSYEKVAFIRELAQWKYQYRHAHDQLTVLATGNNKFYEISDNNYITDVVRFCNKRTEEFEEIKSDRYNYFEDVDHVDNLGKNPVYGSIILKELSLNPDATITFRNYIGLKTDKYNDDGSDYFEITEREDYVSKATILEKGGIILPTLSDKKTYGYIHGIKLPGLDYSSTIDENGNTLPMSNLGDQFIIQTDPMSQYEYMISQFPEVVDQFISYALSEYASVKKADADIDEMEKNGTKETEVDNYYTKEQGAKFSSLLGVWEYEYKTDKDGVQKIVGEKFISFNNNKKSRKENIKIAETHFFNRSREEQEALIQRILHKRLLKEIAKCEELGLIKKIGTSENIFENYENVGLNNSAIQSIYLSLIDKNGYPADAAVQNKYKSLATILYINDISNKAIMSIQEFERVFSGNPAFYSWKYNENGELIDRSVDELKRFGGVVSTGNNNFMELRDIPKKYLDEGGNFTGKYKCAQVANEIIGSPQYPLLQEIMEIGELATAAYLYAEETGATVDIDNMSKQELIEFLPEEIAKIALKKAKESASIYKEDIDVADGAAYISDTMTEMLLRMCGNYSSDIEKAFKILREETPSNILEKHKAFQSIQVAVLGTQKYTAFGRRKHEGTGVQVAYYNKMAVFPIFQCMATGRMQNIFNKMKNQGIDMLMVDSAVKVGGQGSQQINWDDFMQTADEKDPQNHINNDINQPLKPNFNEDFEFNTYEQKFIYLRKQLNTDPTEDYMSLLGTQLTKVALSNLFPKRNYLMQDGSSINGELLLARIMGDINRLSDKGKESIEKRFFGPDGKIDEEKLATEIRKIISSKTPNKNVLAALEIEEDPVTKEKRMAMPLDAVSNSEWLESNIISAINKKVIDINTTGSPFIQRSIWAMEGGTMFERGKGGILSDENLPAKINGGKRLQMINEEGSMDCVLSIDFFKKMFAGEMPRVPIKDKNHNVVWDLVPELDSKGNVVKDADGKTVYAQRKDKQGKPMVDSKGNPVYKRRIRTREMTFTEMRSWLINRGIIGPNAKANIIGFRIPTQAQSSIHALRCVDVIPASVDTVILPAEFTKITGSDFDIDKLFLSCIQYKINREEGDDGKYHQTASDQFDEDSNEAIKNDLLRCYLTLLTDKRSANFLHRSIDLDTKLLKGIVKDIEEGKETDVEEPYGFYSLSRQVTSKNDYVTGKIGIGPFALNNNNHILTMMYGVRFKGSNSSIMSEFGLERLDRRIGNDGESIMSWISALINAHVDIAKDPYITRLNVNPFTYNLVNLLIRTGFGKDTFYFTSQPIMRILSAAYVNAGSMYMSDSFGSKYRLQEEAVEKTAEDLFYDAGITVLGYDPKTIIKWIKEGGKNHSKFIKSLNEEIHRSFAENLRSDAKLFDVTQESLTRQFLVYAAYLQFSKYANALSGLVSYSKIDTKKHGKSIVEQIFYRDKYRNVYDTTRADNVFESDGLRRMQTESYIGLKTKNAINTVLDIMRHQFIEATPAFLSSINTLTKAIGRQDSTSANLIKSLSKALSAAIKSKFFVDEYVPKISSIPSYFHDLVSESQEDLDFVIKQEGNVLKISGNTNYPLSSYVRGGIAITYKGADGKNYTISSKILGVDEKNGNITISRNLPRMYGKVRLLNGKNTIYHRFFKLQADIRSKKEFSKLRSESGDPKNRLLQMIVPGNEIEYTTAYIPGERADTYQNAFFIKLFNFIESSGDESNYIITAWDELLNYSDENKEVENIVREFARDLVVYSFITSGDRSGFTKMFKYVPASWRKESGYADFINKKRAEYSINADIDIDFQDVLLNNWFDNQLVPTYHLQDPIDNSSVFMTYYTKRNGIRYGYPTMLAALKHDGGNLTPSIDPKKAPIFIKIPRRKDRSGKDSQRRYTIYKLLSIARSINGVDYPVYVKTNPKGNSISWGFLITEYGRNDNLFENEYAANEDVIKKTYMAGTISDHVNVVKNTEPVYAAIMSGLAKHYQLGQDSAEEDDTYDDVVLNDTDSITENDDQQLDENIDRQLGTSKDGVLSSEIVFRPKQQIAQQPNQQQNGFDVSKVEFYSGAANGADKVWGTEARALGIKVTDYTRDNWNSLSQEWKNKFSAEYEEVAKALARPIILLGSRGDVEVRRDMMQADKADAIFAIGSVVKPGQKGAKYVNRSDHDVVDGGTGYAVQRGIIRGIPVYVFDQIDNQWKVWDKNSNSFIPTSEPTLTPHAATIGTRGINDAGRQAIKSVLTRTVSQQPTQQNVPASYEGLIKPDANTIFVFGSNPKGIHGAGAAATAKTQFGAIQGQGEGLQGNAYALPTKDLDKAKGTRWYRPGKKEETEVKEWYKNHDYSEVYNHPLNTERTMTPQQIVESIKKLYEVARQNPNRQFKVSHYPFGQLSLNGYLGEEMLAMFKQAGQVPSNVAFNKEWTDHWDAVQPTRFEYTGSANGTIAVRQHSRKLNDTEIKFGRKLISPSESKYVTEKIFLSVGFDQYTEDKLNRFLNIQHRVIDILYGNISPKETVDIKYSDWKQMLQHDSGLITLTNTFEMFVENTLIDELVEANFIEDSNAYDKQNKTLRVGRVAYELIKLLSDNVDYLRFLHNISPSNYIEAILLSERRYTDVSDMITTLISSDYSGLIYEFSDEKIEQNIIKNLIDLRYTYEDSRQLNIFDDSDFSDEAMKHCKG